MKRTSSVLLILSASAFLCLNGCAFPRTFTHTFTYTSGQYVPNSHFAYPNSNIKPLGPVKGQIAKTGPHVTLEIEDIKKVYHDALSQVEGANILINFKQDTSYTTTYSITVGLFGIPPDDKTESRVEYRIEGEAARMEVGTKPLK